MLWLGERRPACEAAEDIAAVAWRRAEGGSWRSVNCRALTSSMEVSRAVLLAPPLAPEVAVSMSLSSLPLMPDA
jgi:hypothetical protein